MQLTPVRVGEGSSVQYFRHGLRIAIIAGSMIRQRGRDHNAGGSDFRADSTNFHSMVPRGVETDFRLFGKRSRIASIWSGSEREPRWCAIGPTDRVWGSEVVGDVMIDLQDAVARLQFFSRRRVTKCDGCFFDSWMATGFRRWQMSEPIHCPACGEVLAADAPRALSQVLAPAWDVQRPSGPGRRRDPILIRAGLT